MMRKSTLILAFISMISVAAFANPFSEWKRLAAKINATYKFNRSASMQKVPEKVPYSVTTFSWDNVSSSSSDSFIHYVLIWNPDSTPNNMQTYEYFTTPMKHVIDTFMLVNGAHEYN